MTGRLAGKRAVVTGAGRGIGRKIAEMYAAEGAAVLACDIDAEALASLADGSTSTPTPDPSPQSRYSATGGAEGVARGKADSQTGGLPQESPSPLWGGVRGGGASGISTFAADLTTEAGAASLAEAAKARLGAVDILVNAAAIVRFAPLDTMSLADWRTTIAGEIDTVFLVTRACWPLLAESGRASIVNFSSANAHQALNGLPAIAHTAGKGAVLAMTRQMAMEGGPLGIRANSIAPGFTVTEETAQHLDTPLMDNVRAKLMVGRLGATEDIGWLAVYLGSDEAGYVTGADFCIDGGATAW